MLGKKWFEKLIILREFIYSIYIYIYGVLSKLKFLGYWYLYFSKNLNNNDIYLRKIILEI